MPPSCSMTPQEAWKKSENSKACQGSSVSPFPGAEERGGWMQGAWWADKLVSPAWSQFLQQSCSAFLMTAILLSYNLTKRRDPALPHTWKSTQMHYIIQRPSSVFCKGFPFSSPYPTKKQGLSFTSGQTYLHVDCSRIQPRRLKSCKKGAGDTNWDLPARWELTVTQPWGNPQHRHEFFPTNTQQASQLPGKLLQLLAKGQLGLNLLEVNLLDLAQSGFKPGCGSGAIQVALMDEALLSAGRGHPSILILLDFSTNHEILLSCLTGGRSPG